MKNKFFFFTLIIFCHSILISQSITQYGWEWLNPKPTHALLHDIKFTDMNTGYSIGGNGTILKTTNGGVNWLFLQTWVQPGFYDYTFMHVFNKDTLIVAGNPTYFYKSINGGANWTAVNYGSSEIINGMYFQNYLTGYAVGSSGTILKTSNGGNSWQQIPTNLQLNMTSVSFPDNNTGYIVGQKIVKTTNGGTTWDTSSSVTNAYCVHFLNNQTGFIGAYGLFMTTNGGLKWNNLSNGAYNFYSIDFIDSLTGWASADNAILKTSNGGFNWAIISSSQGRGISFIDSQNGYACSGDSYGSIIRRTTNGGINWTNLSTRFETGDIYSIYFLNESTGYYGGTSGNLRKTTDGGQSWSTLVSTGHFIESIYFFDENTGFIGQAFGSFAGQIQKTTNGGVNWTSTGTADAVDALSFADINTGYALASRNFIYKTTNSGLSWTAYDVPTTFINGLWAIDANRVMAVGEWHNGGIYGMVVKTTNGGQNWTSQNLGLGPVGNAICFTDLNTGYMACGYAGYGGRILKTTDFGENWTYQTLGNEYSLNAIQFFDANTGMVSGNNGTAFKTTNAGLNWAPYYRVTDYHIFAMHCPSQLVCYFGGWYDIMLKFSDGGTLLNLPKQDEIVPRGFVLQQNYPNPFNPVTKIKFDIPTPLNPPFSQRGDERSGGGFVKLIIYDILGREVVTLINQQLQPGSYSVDWDASNYPSGVYFYKLEVRQAGSSIGDYTQTKKMVLIK
jgi:photosystem II stability/assembly factor-like uncharacterized protein